MKRIVFFLLLFVNSYHAFARIGFWRTQSPRIIFETASQTIHQYNCSGIVTLRNKNAQNVNANVASSVTINLEPVTGITYYSDSNCATPITTATINTGSSSTSFYYLSDSTGSTNISFNTALYGQVVQVTTITTNPFIWTGGGADSNWATALNWSGGAAPNSSQVAVFTNCASNCDPTIAANINVAGIRILSDYSGTITQNATRTITLGGKGFTQYAGTFNASTSSHSFANSGNASFLGGIFNANSAAMTNTGNFIVDGGSFNANNSSILFNASSISVIQRYASPTNFNNVTIEISNATITITGTMIVNGNLTGSSWTGTQLNGGTIEAKGNINLANLGFNASMGSALIKLTGNADQTISASGSSAGFPKLELASTGGTIFLGGTFRVLNDFTYTSGALDAGTSTIKFLASNVSSNFTFSSSISFYNIIFEQSNTTATIVGNLIVNGTLSAQNWSNVKYIGGVIEARGNIDIANNGFTSSSGSTTLLKINGNANQAINSSSSSTRIISTTIESTGGTITLSGTLTFVNNFTLTSGTIDAGTSSVVFSSSVVDATYSFASPLQLNNVKFEPYVSTVTMTGTMIVNGTLEAAAVSNARINSGTIEAKGNVNLTSYGFGDNSGTITLKISGNTDQTISGSSISHRIYNFEMASTGGTVYLNGAVNFARNFTYTSGTLNSGTASVHFRPSIVDVTYNVSSAISFNNVIIGHYVSTITINGTLLVLTQLTGDADGSSYLNGGTIEVQGNITLQNNGLAWNPGTTILKISGSNNQTLNRTLGNCVSINLDKSGGSFTISGYLRVSNNFTVTNGNFSLSNSSATLNVNSTLALNGSTLTKNTGTLIVNSSTIGTGSLFGGTVAP